MDDNAADKLVAIAVLTLAGLIAVARFVSQRGRASRQDCHRCGYDLRHTVARRCPECFATRPPSAAECAVERSAAVAGLETMTAAAVSHGRPIADTIPRA